METNWSRFWKNQGLYNDAAETMTILNHVPRCGRRDQKTASAHGGGQSKHKQITIN